MESEQTGKRQAKEDNFKGATGNTFSETNQPSPELKSKGWAQKKHGKELVKLILEMKFGGKPDGQTKKYIAEYFQVPPEEITNAQMIVFRQMEKAIAENDTLAAKFVWEITEGKPVQQVEQKMELSTEKKINISIEGKDIDLSK